MLLSIFANIQNVSGEYNQAGDANDHFPTTFKFSEENRDLLLTKENGQPIMPHEVPDLYGTSDGFTIYEGSMDVVNPKYAVTRNYHRPLEPVYKDLSEGNGWPDVDVTPGTVAIDPRLGRFKFSDGDSDPMRMVSGLDLPNGRAYDIKIVDNYAYIANEEVYMGLTIIDISNPLDPQITGYCKAGLYPTALDVIPPYAYVMDGYNLYIIDVSNPYNPVQISASEGLGKGAYGIDVLRYGIRTLAFCGSNWKAQNAALFVLDVTFPYKIRPIARLDFDWVNSVYDVNVQMPYAFVSVRHSGIKIVDVSNFWNPHTISSIDANIERGCQVVLVQDHLVFSDYGKGLRVLDVRDLRKPVENFFDWYLDDLDDISLDRSNKIQGMQSVRIEDSRRSITSKPIPVTFGNIVKLDFQAMGYQTYDTVNPPRYIAGSYQILWDGQYKAPHIAGVIMDSSSFARTLREFTVPSEVSTMELRLSSGIFGSANTRGTVWFDDIKLELDGQNVLGNPGFEDGEDKFQLGYIHTRGISLENSRLLVSDFTEGIRLIDINDPQNPRVTTRFKDDTEEYSTYLRGVLRGPIAFMVEQHWGLKVVLMYQSIRPWIMGNVATAGFVQDVVVEGDYAYIANSFSGIWVVDIKDPLDLKIVGNYQTGDNIAQLALDDNGYLYCSNAVLGRVDVLDIKADPENPEKIGDVQALQVMDMVTYRNLLFAASNKATDLYIFEIKDPKNPILRSELALTDKGGYRGMDIRKGVLALACDEGGFFLMTFSDPENPRIHSHFRKDGENPWGIALMDNIAYISYRNGFIRIFYLPNLENPTEVKTISEGLKWPWDMIIDGSYLHVADYKDGVKTYDISWPFFPELKDNLIHNYATVLDLMGEYLYEGHFGSLKVLNCRHSSQAPRGIVNVRYNSVPGFRVRPLDYGLVEQDLVTLNQTSSLGP